MQIIIDIPDKEYELIRHGNESYTTELTLMNAVVNGTPLPKGHGDLIDRDKIGLTNFDILLCNGDYKEILKLYDQSVRETSVIIKADTESEEE